MVTNICVSSAIELVIRDTEWLNEVADCMVRRIYSSIRCEHTAAARGRTILGVRRTDTSSESPSLT